MAAESRLDALLANLAPVRRPGSFVFVSVPVLPPAIPAVVVIMEDKGVTLVVERHIAATAGYTFDSSWAMVTLTVASALDAVGLTAAVAGTLAAAGISCNICAGYHHDHLFVPEERADEAVALLADLSRKAKATESPGC